MFTYQQYISDLNGIDPREHHNDPLTAMRRVRDWLRTTSHRTTIPAPNTLIAQYQQFQRNLPALTQELGFDIDDIPFVDFLQIVEVSVQAQIG